MNQVLETSKIKQTKLCECGCGTEIPLLCRRGKNSKYQIRRFVFGHKIQIKYQKTCKECNHTFETSDKKDKFCNRTCWNEYFKKHNNFAKPEIIEKIRLKNIGRKMHPNTKKILREIHLGSTIPQSQKDKISKSLIEHYKDKKHYKICEECGNTFPVHLSKIKSVRFCSWGCYNKQAKEINSNTGWTRRKTDVISKLCLYCNKSFDTINTQKEFCSDECKRLNWRNKSSEMVCVNCGKTFANYWKGKFCSRDCIFEYRKKQKVLEIKCEWCNKPITTHKCRLKTQVHFFCSKDCNINWKNQYPEQMREHLIYARSKVKLPMKDSSIELKIQNYLKELGIEFFTHQYMKQIKHAYQCDIFIPSKNLIIECDGDAFHFNPKFYKKEDKIFREGMTAEQRWELDNIRTKELLEKGFKVIRIWEHEIKIMSLEDFKNKISEEKK